MLPKKSALGLDPRVGAGQITPAKVARRDTKARGRSTAAAAPIKIQIEALKAVARLVRPGHAVVKSDVPAASVPKQRQQDDDRNRHAQQPKKNSSTHGRSP